MKLYEPSRKTRNTLRILLIVFIAFVAIYISGLSTQVLLMVTRGQAIAVDFNPIVNFAYAFDFSKSKMSWIAEGVIGVLIFAYAIKMSDHRGVLGESEKDRTANFEYSNRGDFGTAKQSNEHEIREFMKVVPKKQIDKINGLPILGYLNDKKKEIVAFPKKDWREGVEYNNNIVVCGNPGSKKSRSFVVNYILQAITRRESVVVSDTKGEIYGWTSELAIKHNYDVKILNLVELEYSDGWDILGEVRNSPEKAAQLARIIIDNTGGKDTRDFWADAEENLLKSIVLLKSVGLADISNKTGKEQTMREVCEFMTLSDDDMKRVFDVLEGNFPFHPAVIPFKEFWRADKIRGQIIHGLANRLQLFQDIKLSKVLGTPEIDLTAPGQKPCIYYLRFSDQHSTYKFVTSLFFSFMYIDLVEYADSLKERILPVKVALLLDECCNIGEIPDFPKKIATVRSRGVDSILCIQDIPQIQFTYKDTWRSIIGCCDTFLFLGCGKDPETAKFISDLTGEATVNKTMSSAMVGNADMRVTSSSGTRMVMTPNQVMTMPRSQELVFFAEHQVMTLTKMDFTEHPMSKEIVETNVTDHQSKIDFPSLDYDKMVIDRYSNYRRKVRDDVGNDNDDESQTKEPRNKKPRGNKSPKIL